MLIQKTQFSAIIINLLIFLYCMSGHLIAADSPSEKNPPSLESGFQDPPRSARPGAFWPWLEGHVSLPQLTRELEEMKEKGMSGAEIWDVGAARNQNDYIPAGPAYLSPGSVQAMQHAIREATRLGLRLGMVTSSGWNAGGAWVKPADASKALYFTQTTAQGPAPFSGNLPFPEIPKNCPTGEDGLPVYFEDVAALAFPKGDGKTIPDIFSIVNLTGRLEKNGSLKWDVPEGEWVILRFVCTNTGQKMIIPSPNSDGYFIDFLDPAATVMHMEYIIGKLLERLGSFEGTAFGYLEVDSMELHEGNPWTGNFLREFTARRGYDALLYLPVLAGWSVKDKDTSDRFVYDYRKTVSDLLIFSHYTTGSRVLEKYGLELVAEAGGPGPPVWNSCPVDALKALGQVHVPRGEFWIRHRNLFLIKEISSAAHIYGKTYVDAESFTTWRRWMDSPFELKKIADRALCEGLNRFTFHTFAHTPPEFGLPGPAYHAGVDINTATTWWQKAKPFITYLARCCHMLSQGLFAGDVCYYYGDKAPNFYPEFHDVPQKIVRPDLGREYDYDVTNSDVILNRMEARDGKIVLPDGMSYELLVLPEREEIPLEVLEKLEELVKAGATIIGPKPSLASGLFNHPGQSERVAELANRLWGPCDGRSVMEHSYGEGTVIWGYTPRQVLERRGIGPDFSFRNADGNTDLDFIHRKTIDEDIYFIRNNSDRWEEAECLFRVSGKKPELWIPESGETETAVTYESVEGGTELILRLPPGGSVFVVFRALPADKQIVSIEKTGPESLSPDQPSPKLISAEPDKIVVQVWTPGTYRITGARGGEKEFTVENIPQMREITGSWDLSFPRGWGAPERKSFKNLISWTDDDEEGVKYFSGTATYSKEIEIPGELVEEGVQLFLDLGKVGEIADVSLNGSRIGILWKPPYRVEITGAAREGINDLRVEVTNLWVNRLTGDQLLPVEKRFCKTNQPAYTSDGGEGRMYRTLPSGLMGPVRIVPARTSTINLGD